jgi:hypothetical protein
LGVDLPTKLSSGKMPPLMVYLTGKIVTSQDRRGYGNFSCRNLCGLPKKILKNSIKGDLYHGNY